MKFLYQYMYVLFYKQSFLLAQSKFDFFCCSVFQPSLRLVTIIIMCCAFPLEKVFSNNIENQILAKSFEFFCCIQRKTENHNKTSETEAKWRIVLSMQFV